MPNVTKTTADAFISELWSDAISDYAEQNFLLKEKVTDVSAELANGGDTLHIPRVLEETAAAKAADTPVTFSANTDDKTTLVVDQHFYSAKRIEDIVRVQESADLFNMYARAMGYSLAKQVENYLASVIQSATANSIALTTADQPSDAEIRDGLKKLMDINVDYTSAYLVGSPAVYSFLLGEDKLTFANETGQPAGQKSGTLGQAYGMDTFHSPSWATGASIFTKDSVRFAMQIKPRVKSNWDIEHIATRVVTDVLFGAVLTQPAADTAGQIVNLA